jgi:hypothetical protein
LSHPSAPAAVPVVDEFDAPNDLTTEERLVWLELAPHAFANGTLLRSTSLAFRRLCRHIVLERRYANSVTDAGGANHRGLIQRVDTALLGFNLAPSGRRPATEAQKADPLEDKYFGGSRHRA